VSAYIKWFSQLHTPHLTKQKSTDRQKEMLLKNNCLYTLPIIFELILETHYVMVKAHCQGHCAKVNFSTSAPHKHIKKVTGANYLHNTPG